MEDNIMDEFDFYLSNNNRLIFPKKNISFLCSISESTIPSMPEAVEASVVIAGRDGDIVLNTTYNPLLFELVLYTEDNLTPSEKVSQETFLTHFCNEMKNKMKTFAIESENKFYKVKYNGVLERTNYPAHLVFTLPFKSSNAYAYNTETRTITGASSFNSNTIEDCGFECTIVGPALNPIVSLNNTAMEYANTVLENHKLIINTNNSTVTLVNEETGLKSNAMRYSNHLFPKIKYGQNNFQIISGIEDSTKVSIVWNDLIL